jgi:hypothetical protein
LADGDQGQSPTFGDGQLPIGRDDLIGPLVDRLSTILESEPGSSPQIEVATSSEEPKCKYPLAVFRSRLRVNRL